ncbi:MAG: NAD(P)H-dependent flavin oxidoreductase [Candidatus Hodarchaeales archaeon]|jgi:NAD(P)H-dependent flavin oxidoreductase YrpB (nitropropane dioxygenase family)
MVFKTEITEMLGIKHPIMAAPMGPFYTTDLTIAVSEAGGLGILSHTGLSDTDPIEEMKKNMETVIEHTEKPFGFNIRTSRMEPYAYNLCSEIPEFIMNNEKLKKQCIYALTSAGSAKMLPSSDSFQKLKENGSKIKHFHVAPALWLAEKCVNANVDGIVVTGSEGGGHQSYENVSTLVLLQQVQQKFPNIPKVACGGFSTGGSLAAALSLGAGAVAMGSRFIASKESEFHDTYKKVVPSAKAQDTIMATGVFGPIRLWKNQYAFDHTLVADKEEKMAQEAGLSQDDILNTIRAYEMAYEGNIEEGAVLLGQSIGIIDKIEEVSTIIENMLNDAEVAIKKVNNFIK